MIDERFELVDGITSTPAWRKAIDGLRALSSTADDVAIRAALMQQAEANDRWPRETEGGIDDREHA